MKILVIDPDKTMRGVLIKTLGQSAVFSPFEAEDINSGAAVASQEKPDIIFADFDSFADDPDGSIKQLKKSSPPSKIIIISGVGSDENIVRAALASGGAQAVVSKPFRAEEIRRVMGDVARIPTDVATEISKSATQPAGKGVKDTSWEKRRRVTSFAVYITTALVVLAVVAASLYFFVLKPHPQPTAAFATGLKNFSFISATSDGRLILTDWQSGTIFFYMIPSSPLEKSLIQTASVVARDVQPSAAAVFESHGKTRDFLITDSLQGMIFTARVDMENETAAATAVSRKCTILKSYKAPDASPSGVLVVKRWLPPPFKKISEIWTYDSVSKKLYRHNPSDFSVAEVYELPVENPAGMAFMGGHFYIGDASTGRIIELNPSDMSVLSIIRPRVYSFDNPSGAEHLAGITSDGNNLWSVSESGMVYRHHPSEFSTDIK